MFYAYAAPCTQLSHLKRMQQKQRHLCNLTGNPPTCSPVFSRSPEGLHLNGLAAHQPSQGFPKITSSGAQSPQPTASNGYDSTLGTLKCPWAGHAQ